MLGQNTSQTTGALNWLVHWRDRKLVLWWCLCEGYALVTSTIWNVACDIMSPSTTDFHAPSKSQGSKEPGSLPPSFSPSYLDLLLVYSAAQAGLTLVVILLPHSASHGIMDMPSLVELFRFSF